MTTLLWQELRPFVVDIFQAIAMLILAGIGIIGGFALNKLRQKLGLEANASAMANLDSAAVKSIALAVMQAQQQIKDKGWDDPDVQKTLVRIASANMVEKFPSALHDSGVNPKTDTGKGQVRDVVTRALPEAVAVAAASPATPPVADPVKAPVPVTIVAGSKLPTAK